MNNFYAKPYSGSSYIFLNSEISKNLTNNHAFDLVLNVHLK